MKESSMKMVKTRKKNGSYIAWNRGKRGVYTKESLEKMKLAHIGKRHSEEHKKKISESERGKIVTEETRKKMSLSRRGNKNSSFGKPAWNRKDLNEEFIINEFIKNKKLPIQIAKNLNVSDTTIRKRLNKYNLHNSLKGKTYEELYGFEESEKRKERLRISHLGKGKKWDHVSPLKGKKSHPQSKESIRKTVEKRIKNKSYIAWNKGLTKEDPRIFNFIKNANLNPNFGMKGKHHTKETLNKFKELRKNLILPFKDTKIEQKIQSFLTQLHIEYLAHKYMHILHGYQCDIWIPVQEGITQKTIIECDGDAFHFNPNKYKKDSKIFKDGMIAQERWDLDKIRTQELQESGFRVIRLWEDEIRVIDLNNFKEILT